MKKILTSNSIEETEQIAKNFAQTLGKTDVVAFFGDLGAGKTAFSRGIMAGLGFDCDVTSPTFAIINEYQNDSFKVAHFDMYRINSEHDLFSTGYYDYLENCIILIEWSENIATELPKKLIEISLTHQGETTRIIEINDKRN